MPTEVLRRLARYRLFEAGFPFCCETHTRNYFMVVYDIGDHGETSYKMGLN